ncbi:MAG: hypothetical protein ABIP45_09845 [Knoellia sp.]
MTIHAVRPADLWLADLHRARAEAGLTMAKRQRWNRWGWAAVSLLQGFNWFLINHGGWSGVLWGSVALVGFVLLGFAGEVLDAHLDRRSVGPAGPGPSSLGQVATRMSGHDVWVAVNAALAAQGASMPLLVDPNTVEASLPSRFGVRGFLTVRVEGVGESVALVTVWARPDLTFGGGWGMNDRGRSRATANAVLRAIPGGTAVG